MEVFIPVGILRVIMGVVYILLCVILIVVILAQSAKQGGVGVLGGETDSYFGKNGGKTYDAMLSRLTKVLCVFFGVISILLGMLVNLKG